MKIHHVAAFLLLVPGFASANEIDARNPDTVLTALQDLGYRATLGSDSDGDPKVTSTIEAVNYTIFFYGCRDGLNCESIQFAAAFDVPEVLTAAMMNDWNTTKLMGEATVADDGDPRLTFFVTTTGGLTRENFVKIVALWGASMSDFKDFIDW